MGRLYAGEREAARKWDERWHTNTAPGTSTSTPRPATLSSARARSKSNEQEQSMGVEMDCMTTVFYEG